MEKGKEKKCIRDTKRYRGRDRREICDQSNKHIYYLENFRKKKINYTFSRLISVYKIAEVSISQSTM